MENKIKLKAVSYTIDKDAADKVSDLANKYNISKSAVLSIILHTFFDSLDKFTKEGKLDAIKTNKSK